MEIAVVCVLENVYRLSIHNAGRQTIYPHMQVGKVRVDISFTVYLFVRFARLRITPLRIKLAASYLARRFISVKGRESPIFVNFAPKSDKSNSARATPIGM